MKKKIVVLGVGYAGALVAKKLEKKLKGQDVSITVIDKNPFFTMLSELHEVAAWRVEEDHVRCDVKKIFAGRDINFELDTIEEMDFDNNKLIGKVKTYDYDYLVMASGCTSTYFGIEGAKEYTFPLWSYDEAVTLRHHLAACFRDAARETDPAKRKAMLTFYCIGAGFTGVEMIAELAEWMPFACEKYKVNPEEVTMYNVDFLDQVLPVFPQKCVDRVQKRMEKLGIKFKFKTKVVGVGPDFIKYEDSQGNVHTDATYTVMWTAGIEGSEIAQKTADRLGQAERTRARIQTDKYLRSLNHPNVYVAGDNTFYIPESTGEPVPQMVEHCEHGAPVIAQNIVDELMGKEPSKEYNPQFHGSMVSVGGRYASAHVGMPGRFFILPSFFAMLSKHFIAIFFFISLAGWSKIFSHLKFQFFTIRNNRSILGGHFTNKAPNFTLFPLRVFMGVYMIYNAYVRFAYGWLSQPMLSNSLETAARQFRPVFPIPGTSMEAAITFWNTHRFSTVMAEGTSTLWFQSAPVSAFVQTFILSNEVFWQTIIVLAFVLIGLAYIGGLFTTLASFGYILFPLVLLLTVGLPMYSVWMLVAPIAFMFTGGKVLSLDYYVMPQVHKWWKNVGWVKKNYLYHD